MAKQKPVDITAIKVATLLGLIGDPELAGRLVLKGGNALELVYKISTRASFDLDFSIEGAFESIEWLARKVENGLKKSFGEIGMEVFDLRVDDQPPNLTDDVRDFWGGYTVQFKVIQADVAGLLGSDIEQLRKLAFKIGPTQSTVFKVDISRHEWCEFRQVQRIKSEQLLVYRPELIVAEKLRAICQQSKDYSSIVKREKRAGSPRARDFVDIESIREWFPGLEWISLGFRSVVERCFAAKRVPFDLLLEIPRDREFHRSGFESVRATVRPDVHLATFDHYFDRVVEFANELHALRNVDPPASIV